MWVRFLLSSEKSNCFGLLPVIDLFAMGFPCNLSSDLRVSLAMADPVKLAALSKVGLARDFLEGLAHLHTLNIIHR